MKVLSPNTSEEIENHSVMHTTVYIILKNNNVYRFVLEKRKYRCYNHSNIRTTGEEETS